MDGLGVILILIGVVLIVLTWTESTGQVLGVLLGGSK